MNAGISGDSSMFLSGIGYSVLPYSPAIKIATIVAMIMVI